VGSTAVTVPSSCKASFYAKRQPNRYENRSKPKVA
jgi:hypothetical protein